jgi:hypothetical protein
LFCADAADLGTGDAFVVTIVPLSNVFGDLNVSVTGEAVCWSVAMAAPRQGTGVLQIEQLEGALGTLARRDVSVALGREVPTCQ